jgi:hypothetical protein
VEVFVDERKVNRNKQIGRWASLGGLGVLVAGMVVSITRSDLVWVTLLCLAVGFLATTIGAYYANHWTRSPRADEVLTQALKGMSNRYHLYHYLLPVAHVLLGPSGLFVFRAYVNEGPISYDGKKWKQKRSLLRSLGFSGQDALADPVRDTLYDVERLRRLLAKNLPSEGVPRITPFIVFVRDGVELDVAETEVPVLRYKQLKGRIRRIDKECKQPLGESALYEIEQAMLGERIDEL